LCLSRREGEVINVGDDVTITLVRIKGAAARIGVVAPRDIGVHRGEVYQRIQTEKRKVAGDTIPQAVESEWLAARDVISRAVQQLRPDVDDDDANSWAAAIIARLASHNPPILLEMQGGAA
jgi:carbon storage regulator